MSEIEECERNGFVWRFRSADIYFVGGLISSSRTAIISIRGFRVIYYTKCQNYARSDAVRVRWKNSGINLRRTAGFPGSRQGCSSSLTAISISYTDDSAKATHVSCRISREAATARRRFDGAVEIRATSAKFVRKVRLCATKGGGDASSVEMLALRSVVMVAVAVR